jgi:hypothetical protein
MDYFNAEAQRRRGAEKQESTSFITLNRLLKVNALHTSNVR